MKRVKKPEQQEILNVEDIGWLTNKHMLKANNILKKDYPSVDGLQSTLL